MVLEQAVTTKKQEVAEAINRLREVVAKTKEHFLAESAAIKAVLSHKSLLSYRPLDTSKDDSIAPLFLQLLAAEKELTAFSVEEIDSLPLTKGSLKTLKTKLTDLDAIADTVYSTRDKLHQSLAEIKAANDRYKTVRLRVHKRLDDITNAATLSNYQTEMFIDESFSQYPSLFQQLKAKAEELKKDLNKQTTALIKKGLSPHKTILAMLEEASDIYSRQDEVIKEIEEALKEPRKVLFNARYNLSQLEILYQEHAQRLLERTSLTLCDKAPYSESPIVQNYQEVIGALRTNITECMQVHQQAIADIEINSSWVTSTISETKQATLYLENIEATVNREYDLVMDEIHQIEDIIECHRREISARYQANILSIQQDMKEVSEYLEVLKTCGISLSGTPNLKETFLGIQLEANRYIDAESTVEQLSDQSLYHKKELLIEKLTLGHRVITDALKGLLSKAKQVMKAEKQHFNHKIDKLCENLDDLRYFTDDKEYKACCFLEPGSYQFKGREIRLSERNAIANFRLPPSLNNAIRRHQFESLDESSFAPPLAARAENIHSQLQQVQLEEHELIYYLIEESVRRRQASDVMALVSELIENINVVKSTVQIQNTGQLESDITVAIKTLDTVSNKLSNHQQAYTDLKIPSKKAFLTGIKHIIEDSILHGPIEHLSDGIRPYAVQLLRIYILRPFLDFCRSRFGLFQDRLTFFASENERAFVNCGIEAKRHVVSKEDELQRAISV